MLHVENMATFGKFTVAPEPLRPRRFERSTRKMILEIETIRASSFGALE